MTQPFFFALARKIPFSYEDIFHNATEEAKLMKDAFGVMVLWSKTNLLIQNKYRVLKIVIYKLTITCS